MVVGDGTLQVAAEAATHSAGLFLSGLWLVPAHVSVSQMWERKAVKTQAWWGPAMSAVRLLPPTISSVLDSQP